MPEKVEMSKLFGRHNTPMLYSFMIPDAIPSDARMIG